MSGIRYAVRHVADNIALIRDEPNRVVVSEMDLDSARALAGELAEAIRRAEAFAASWTGA
ncbi:hypothetical protein [Rhizosaccharibacter radicis]|uniref:Aldehyde dehydrogenase family protein n=1 Tax=Rhizosaccharibacter radicis TaxID=2782605 RepID=A0ABT1VYN2_9PROT|nr:hypothetical protein [Acetobacteraceae bacterium KSS12]